jgi:hypothetical protein
MNEFGDPIDAEEQAVVQSIACLVEGDLPAVVLAEIAFFLRFFGNGDRGNENSQQVIDEKPFHMPLQTKH